MTHQEFKKLRLCHLMKTLMYVRGNNGRSLIHIKSGLNTVAVWQTERIVILYGITAVTNEPVTEFKLNIGSQKEYDFTSAIEWLNEGSVTNSINNIEHNLFIDFIDEIGGFNE